MLMQMYRFDVRREYQTNFISNYSTFDKYKMAKTSIKWQKIYFPYKILIQYLFISFFLFLE